MSDLVPTSQAGALSPVGGFGGGAMLDRVRDFTAQPAVRKAMPWFIGAAAIGVSALAWSVVSPAPQRTLYTQLDDGQRASVVEALDKAAIRYSIDNATGALTVNEEDLYRARMVVASDGALATPESGIELLDNLPLGASRTMEGERLRIARERELMLTIKEIDGVEAVRVHLAEPERSVFVRDDAPPSASVMVRLAKGRQLSDAQVSAIANLVASSVNGLPIDNVRIVDQNGRLLSDPRGSDTSGIELQAQMEEKLRAQVSQLLAPVLGPENFSSEIQVELDLEARTSARESYDKQGVVREETQETMRSGSFGGFGVPGALSNSPPAPGTIQQGPEQPGAAQMGAQVPPSGETRASRSYELGREVAVINVAPGSIKRISVAVALSAEAMKNGKASDIEKIRSLVAAAVGAVPERGDRVEVIARNFAETAIEPPAFYETGWFAMVVRYAAALLGVLLILLLGVRPLLRILRGKGEPDGGAAVDRVLASNSGSTPATERVPDVIDRSLLNRQVGAAQRIVEDRPDRAVIAIRQMLNQTQ